jgi:hypothetical protein
VIDGGVRLQSPFVHRIAFVDLEPVLQDGRSAARLTLGVYAQAVAKLGEAAAEAMGARYLASSPRDGAEIGPAVRMTGRLGRGVWRGVLPEPERRIELLTYALRVRCSAV